MKANEKENVSGIHLVSEYSLLIFLKYFLEKGLDNEHDINNDKLHLLRTRFEF